MTLKKCNKTNNPKPDTAHNDNGIEEVIGKCMNNEKRLYPLRINKTTVIYVTKNKCNDAYKQEYLDRMEGMQPKAKTRRAGLGISKEMMQSAIAEGITQIEMGRRFNVSTTTIRNKLKEYELI